MIYFISDYSSGATPEILAALNESNRENTVGYGEDHYCQDARELIKNKIGRSDADIHFLVGGTQTNLTAIAAFLRSHQGVISQEEGHICVHETGAIEATGHKVIVVPAHDCKILPRDIERIVKLHNNAHMVMPKMVYLSDVTELGTVYTKSELLAIRKVCDQYGLYLYLDGARLGTALTAEKNDMTIEDIANLTDAFYIGGTKNGALFGEALVILNPSLKEEFRWVMKQKGAMLAKGRLLGIQFKTLFTDDLYFKLAKHANCMADKLRKGIEAKGYDFYTRADANLIFPILSAEKVASLEKKVKFEKWAELEDGRIAVRFATSWSSTVEEVDQLLAWL